MNTYEVNQYVITTSLNERAIYLKIVNNVSYISYEGNFDVTSFKLPFDLANIMELINKSFEETDEHYKVKFELDNGILKLAFQCMVGGFLKVAFDLKLREKLMSNDAQLSINFQRLEQMQLNSSDAILKRLAEMERRLEALGHADICFTEQPSGQASQIKSYPIDSKTLDITDGGNHISVESFKKIQYFYQLKSLILRNCQWSSPEINVSNKTVKTLIIGSTPNFRDIKFIQNFPSLEELEMHSVAVDGSIVTTLRSLKHKIKKLKFVGCTGINQAEMQTYCTQHNIELSLA